MLRTNLASRPFYNQRAFRVMIAVAAAATLALTIYNAWRIVSLGAMNRELGARAAAAEARTGELDTESRRIRDALGRANIDTTAAAAQEANGLIDRRAFSWTALFNRFEETLPGDVRITNVQPQVDRDGRFQLTVGVVSRSVEALDTFMTALEESGAFRTTLAVQQQRQDDGMFRSTIRTEYRPSAGGASAASESPEAGVGARVAGEAP